MPPDNHILFDGPTNASRTIVLAHGAGAGMDTSFMEAFAKGIAEQDIRVARFEFPYMAERRRSGKKKPPDRAPALVETWRQIIERLGSDGLVIGGKSMGGRIASLVADEMKVAGLVCVGYPFHPVGKPDKVRTEHLQSIKTPALILQGTRDPFGNQDEVAKYHLSEKIRIVWVKDGDHSFKPRKASGRTEQENWTEAIAAIVAFVEHL